MTQYSSVVTSDMKDDIDYVAKQAVKMVKSDAPVKKYDSPGSEYPPGSYKNSWTNRTVEENSYKRNRTIYSKGHGSLTHLLENGHEIKFHGKSYGKSEKYPHIAPAEEWAVAKFNERTKEHISHGL